MIDEGRRPVRVVRRGSGSVMTWRWAEMVLLSAQGMHVTASARVGFTSEDRVRDSKIPRRASAEVRLLGERREAKDR